MHKRLTVLLGYVLLCVGLLWLSPVQNLMPVDLLDWLHGHSGHTYFRLVRGEEAWTVPDWALPLLVSSIGLIFVLVGHRMGLRDKRK